MNVIYIIYFNKSIDHNEKTITDLRVFIFSEHDEKFNYISKIDNEKNFFEEIFQDCKQSSRNPFKTKYSMESDSQRNGNCVSRSIKDMSYEVMCKS